MTRRDEPETPLAADKTAAEDAPARGKAAGRVTRGAGIIAAFTLLSRIAGFIRDQVIVHVFGATRTTDVFWIAFTIPNVMRRLVAEGALTVAWVPVYKEVLHKEGEDASRRFLSASVGLVGVAVLVLTVLGVLGAEGLVWVFASGLADEPEAFALGVKLTRWLFPYVYLISFVALAMGALNAHDRYAAPAAAPVLLNIAFIVLTLFAVELFDPPIFVLVGGVLLGGLLQVLLQIPALWRAGLLVRPTLDLKSGPVRELLHRLAPQLFGLAVYQVNIILLRQFASYLPSGQLTYYYNADRLMQFAYGIFAVAIAQAALPAMSEQTARGEYDELLKTWRFSTRLTSFVTVPATLGLMGIALPIVSTWYLHGAFQWEDVVLTASTTMAFAPGLVAQGSVRTTVQVFYALGDTKTPVWVSAISVVAVLVFGFLLLPYEVVGLASALSIASWIQLVALLWLLRAKLARREDELRLGMGSVLKAVGLQLALAAVAVGAAVGVATFGVWEDGLTTRNVLALFGAIGAAVAIYGVGAVVLRMEEADAVVGKVLRKVGIRR